MPIMMMTCSWWKRWWYLLMIRIMMTRTMSMMKWQWWWQWWGWWWWLWQWWRRWKPCCQSPWEAWSSHQCSIAGDIKMLYIWHLCTGNFLLAFFFFRWGDPEKEDSCKIATDRKFLGANGQYLFISLVIIARLTIFTYSDFKCDV